MLVIDWVVTGVLLLYVIASTCFMGYARGYVAAEGSLSFKLQQWVDSPSTTLSANAAKGFVALSSGFYFAGVFVWLFYGIIRGFISPG